MKEIWCWKEEKWVDPEDATHKREKCLDTEMVIEKERFKTFPEWGVCVACSGMSLTKVRFYESEKRRIDGTIENELVKKFHNPPKDR